MAWHHSNSLRWAGGILLGLAVLMLAAGELWLKHRLSGIPLLVYWAVCLLFTGGAMVLALLDLQRVRRQTREQQREMLQDALQTIQDEAQNRRQRK